MIEATTAGAGLVHDLGAVERIPLGEGRVFVVADREVAVFRARDGRIFASAASCPHRGGPLADGLLGGSTVVCPLHGFRFDLATGAPKGNDCRAIVTYPASVDDRGHVLVRVESR